MGKFDLTTITGHLKEHPLLEPNRFEVIVTGPVDIKQYILFNCHDCSIPGHNIGAFDHSIIGPPKKLPNEEIYDSLSTTFYNNHHLDELKIMDKWIKKIGGDGTYRLAYYNDIVSEMQINIYNLREKLTTEVKIFEAYPTGISEVNLSYGGDMPSEVTINWNYHTFELIDKTH
jgi:hypothetical protein